MEWILKHQSELWTFLSPLLVAICGFFYKKLVVPSLKSAKRMYLAVEKIERIHSELYTNGGSSLRDAINRIEKSQDLIENRSKSIVMTSKSGYFETNAQGGLVWANKTFVALAARQHESLAGMGWITSLVEDDHERVAGLWRATVADKRDLDCEVQFINTETGEITPVHLRAYVMKDRKGDVLGWIGYAQKVN